MTTSQSDQEFDDLLDQLCKGLLSDPEWQRLVELLGQSETHRQRYLNYIELHASLWSGGAVRPALAFATSNGRNSAEASRYSRPRPSSVSWAR